MKDGDIAKVPKKGDHIFYHDELKDDLELSGVDLSTCQFKRLGAKNAKIQNSSLTQCLFEDTYLRNAQFKNVLLTGSTFRKCNLEKAGFQGCDLRYCTFESTLLNKDEIISNLPAEPNLQRDLARNLRKNFESLGDKDSADVFIDIEIKAHEKDLKSAFLRKTAYYRSHYTPVGQAFAGLKWIISWLSGIVWGYGHRVRRLVRSYIILILFFALFTHFGCLEFNVDDQHSVHTLGLLESIFQSFAVTIGSASTPYTPVSLSGKFLQLFEGLFGTILLAMLVATLYRRIAR